MQQSTFFHILIVFYKMTFRLNSFEKSLSEQQKKKNSNKKFTQFERMHITYFCWTFLRSVPHVTFTVINNPNFSFVSDILVHNHRASSVKSTKSKNCNHERKLAGSYFEILRTINCDWMDQRQRFMMLWIIPFSILSFAAKQLSHLAQFGPLPEFSPK